MADRRCRDRRSGSLAFAAFSLTGPVPLLINEGPSLPRGVYVRTDARPERGAVVAIAQPVQARPYLESLGMPPGTRLLKRVAASGGDRVCGGPTEIRLKDRTLLVQTHDGRGARLPRWSECRVLAPDERFLAGDTPTSFDSRNFGPARTAAIEGVYRRIWTR